MRFTAPVVVYMYNIGLIICDSLELEFFFKVLA
jgi:hypothetical protein